MKREKIKRNAGRPQHKVSRLRMEGDARAEHKRRIWIPLIGGLLLALLVVGLLVAGKAGLFQLTFGKEVSGPANSGPASSAVPQPEKTPEPSLEPTSTPPPTPTPAPTPTPEPPSEKYPEMRVEKQAYVERTEGDKVVYLTFDDGPCGSTPKLLDVLDECGVKATFFVTAQFQDDETLVASMKQIYDRGHEVAVHSYSHDYKAIYRSVGDYLDDYKKMDDLIVEATGRRSKVFRFPGGSNAGFNSDIRDSLLREMNSRGFTYHDWNAFSGDAEGADAKAQVERAVTECLTNEKDVLLMHNTPDKDSTIEALPQIVSRLKERGYRFALLDDTVRPFQFASPEE